MRKLPYKKFLVMAAVMALTFAWLPKNIASAEDLGTPPTGVVTPAPTTQTLPVGLGTVPTPAATQSVPPANAPLNPYACGITSLATCIPFLLFYLMWAFVSIFVSLGVWLVTTFLTLSQHVFDSPAVQNGFGISLSLANLGFVLGIIVIAIATILRNQTYGMKQLLWKLVLMAILVNFGLVITRPIVAFSDSMTNYFVTAIGGSTNNFATTLASAFNTQNLLSDGNSQQTETAFLTKCQATGMSASDCKTQWSDAAAKDTGSGFVGNMISLKYDLSSFRLRLFFCGGHRTPFPRSTAYCEICMARYTAHFIAPRMACICFSNLPLAFQ
jgi:hypothetical protein